MRTIPASICGNNCIDSAHLRAHVLWSDFNRRLTEDAQRLPNEARFEQWLEELTGIEIADPRLFWLTLARLAELALKQAADYADHCEFQAAGDLLVNPRRIEIFVQGKTDPVIKKRHCGLREQFALAIGREEPTAWLSRKTLSHVCEKALIPHLKERLISSGWMRPDYLAMLDRRMCRVADTIAFLAAWQIADCRDLTKRMVPAAREDRALIEANLCRFDLDCFNEMGDDIERIVCNANASSRFLNERDFPLSQ
ncbi:hypothetical protein [uncultured Desulfosarcina sp.]|uniref:hypothetical protein n=1 Tax=uncultured Desulfosarcina sp. TaxID=218289 RepID=UPI0029C89A47|nr:hypothetical protein [uncultured Desulfosarcina sp.]